MKLMPRHLAALALLVLLGGTLAYSLSLWVDAAQLGWPGMGIEIQTNINPATGSSQPRTVLVAENVEPRGPAAAAGIQKGDKIAALDGSSERLVERFRTLTHGQRAKLTLDGNPPREVWLQLQDPLHRSSAYVGVLTNVLMGLISVAIGAYVFWRRPDDSRTLILFVFTAAYTLVRFVQAGPRYRYALYLDARVIPFVLMIGASLLVSPALLHFLLIFPHRRPVLDRYPRLLAWIYGLPAVAWAVLSTVFLLSVSFSRPGANPFDGVLNALRPVREGMAKHGVAWVAIAAVLLLAVAAALLPRMIRDIKAQGWRRAFLGHPARTGGLLIAVPGSISAITGMAGLAAANHAISSIAVVIFLLSMGVVASAIALCLALLFPLAGFMAALRSYRESDREERQQLKWPLLGVLIAIPLFVLTSPVLAAVRWAFHLPFDSTASVVLHNVDRNLPSLALLLIPVSVAFAVQKYRLMDIDVYVRRTVIYGVVSAILGLVYLLVVAGLGSAVSNVMNITGDWVPVGSTLILATLFVPVRNRVQRFVDKRFYRDTDYSGALRALAVRLARRDKRSELLQSAVEAIQEAVKVRGVTLWLANRNTGDFACEAKIGPPDTVFDFTIPGGGPITESLSRGPGAPPWSRLTPAETAALRAARAAFLVPILSPAGHRGFLTLGAKLSDAAFDNQDREFLEAAAAQIAAFLQTVRTREEEQDFERARDIQLAMLPKSIPQPPGVSIYGSWQPARMIGGDYYDVIDLGDSRYGIAIADVSGKGFSAALLMSNLQAAVRVLALERARPSVVCHRANQIICANVTPGRFITFFCAVLDTAARTVTYCNAGHNPPLLFRASGTTLQLEEGGPLLGFFQNAAFDEHTVQLEPGDRLLLYTDGLSEAENGAEEEFGEERLIQILSDSEDRTAAEIGQRLIEEVGRFCSGRFEDDVTMLVVALDPTAKAKVA